MTTSALLTLQISQITRLIETKKLSFSQAHYVIFSDYPTREFFLMLVNMPDVEKTERFLISYEKFLVKSFAKSLNK